MSLSSFAGGAAFANGRVALVIGNGAYRNVPALVNPANDARDVAAALKRLGFETILAMDQDKAGMEDAEIRFARAANNADVAIFYYSGHALQFAGVNYLAPVDARLSDEADLKRMVRVDDLVADLQRAKSLRILVLDSCRNNPLADELKRSLSATRALELPRGLAKMDAPQGMIVAYSTQSGHEAYDGDDKNSRNSPYTKAFLKDIELQDEIGMIFRQVSSDVYDATGQQQLPELSLSIIGKFYLHGTPELSPKPEDMAPRDFEAAKSVDTIGAWDAFLKQHTEGFYASLAKELRAKAEAKLAMVAPVAPAAAPSAPAGAPAIVPRPQPAPATVSVAEVSKLGLSVAPASTMAGAGLEGVVVTAVDPNGRGAERGLRQGDVILEVSGRPVTSSGDVRDAISAAEADGKSVILMRVQANGQRRFVAVPLVKG